MKDRAVGTRVEQLLKAQQLVRGPRVWLRREPRNSSLSAHWAASSPKTCSLLQGLARPGGRAASPLACWQSPAPGVVSSLSKHAMFQPSGLPSGNNEENLLSPTHRHFTRHKAPMKLPL